MKRKSLLILLGIILLTGLFVVSQQLKVNSPRLPANEFFVHPGESVYVGFPSYADPSSLPDPAVMPALVDHPYLLAESLEKSVDQPLRLKVDANVASNEHEPKKIKVAVSRVGLEPRLKVFSAFEREFPLTSLEGPDFLPNDDLQYELRWHKISGEETKWAILNMGKLGDRSLEVLIVIAAKPESISDRLIMPDTAFFRKVQVGVLKGAR